MKKLSIALIILFGAALMIGCGTNTADLAFKNGESGGNLNEVIWEAENKSWNNVYGPDVVTESKEVSKLNSKVVAEWWDTGTLVEVYFPQENSSSLSLSPGESYVYTIQKL